MSSSSTIFQLFKTQELEEKQRRADCVAAIKKIHVAGPDIVVSPPPRRLESVGMVMKCSPSGRFIGWYRAGQKAGLPNRLTPLEQDMEKHYQQWKKSVIAAFPKSITSSILGVRSGRARRERGLYQNIINFHQQLASDGIPKHLRSKLIASKLNCNVEFVRRTLRQIK